MKKVSKKDLVILAVILAAFSIFVIPRIFLQEGKAKFDWSKKTGAVYYCPMHPTYTSDRPGDCPICNMKLVKKPDSRASQKKKILYYRHPMGQPDVSPVPKKDSMGMDYIPVYEGGEPGGEKSRVPGHASLEISLDKQQLIGVKLGTVEKRRIKKEIRTTGRVAFDPELYTAQREFISAAGAIQKSHGGPYHEPIERAKGLLDSARTRLRLLGMSEEEINELEQNPMQDKNLILPSSLRAPQSGAKQSLVSRNDIVWVYGNIYEYELPFVEAGSAVKVYVPTFPDQTFTGEVRGLTPKLDAATRSIQIRARVQNPGGLLKPEMYVDLALETDLGDRLVVPEEAVMETGERRIVFVAQGDGYFEPREVTLGARAGDFYEIKSGLTAGEQVVVSGNFLIDSESRLQGALQGMGSGGGHQHGA